MRAVVQRVSRASVEIEGKIFGKIKEGIVVFVAINETDNDKSIEWMSNKLVNLRIFPDENGKMDKSVSDIRGGILLISNFTLYGDAKKGFRPSFIQSAKPEFSEPMFNKLLDYLRTNYDLQVETGKFGAMMNIELVNDGPVTIIIDY
ncbi:MAG: D-aminoacyl-tRNA deacylase [Candidatus Kapabacteria bacterium]|nr:D-aminoacyl-tRNA deacylase [Candidatus Kapabacteria bacterium]